jgi:catechol 2,3-dioxygenase-like lactoylglutathione lyase family enzyme
MINGGNATVMVSDMDRAVGFYTETLGLELVRRFGNHWAEVKAGDSLVIGLHPQSEHSPKPGTAGSISIGLGIDEAIDPLVEKLKAQGVVFHGPVTRDEQGGISLAFFGDPDGNSLYLCQYASR